MQFLDVDLVGGRKVSEFSSCQVRRTPSTRHGEKVGWQRSRRLVKGTQTSYSRSRRTQCLLVRNTSNLMRSRYVTKLKKRFSSDCEPELDSCYAVGVLVVGC